MSDCVMGVPEPDGTVGVGALPACRICTPEVEFREFQCVRIFTHETGSKGLEVAQLPDRRYRY